VTEPGPTHGNVDTAYAYDSLDRLTTVSMTRGAVTQTRTFAYFGWTRNLTQTSNPENGTVQYEYDGAQRMWRKTDAKRQKVVYAFDSYNRVTEINRYAAGAAVPDACQRTRLYYDVNPFVGGFSLNTWGRLAAAEWGGGGAPAEPGSRRCTATRRRGRPPGSGCASRACTGARRRARTWI
jgi:YD repeat-containing protein